MKTELYKFNISSLAAGTGLASKGIILFLLLLGAQLLASSPG